MAHTRGLWIGTFPAAGPGTESGVGEGVWRVTLDVRTGALADARQVVATPAPSFLAQDASRLYAVIEDALGRLSAFHIDGDDLSPLGVATTSGAHPCHVIVHRATSSVLAANYSSGSVAVLHLDDDGVPEGEPAQLVAFTGSGPVSDRQDASHAHHLLPTPDDRHVLVSDLGADVVWRLRIDTSSRRFMDEGVAVVLPAGAGPRHAVFSPDGRLLRVVGELDQRLHTIAWDTDTATGVVIDSTPLSDRQHAGGLASHITRSDDELVVGLRGPGVLAVHTAGGGGTSARRTITLPGDWPRHHAVVGEWIVVALQTSDAVVSLDRLGRVAGRVDIPSPSCVLPAS